MNDRRHNHIRSMIRSCGEISAHVSPLSIFQHISRVTVIPEIGHSERHIYTVVLLGNTVHYNEKLVVDHRRVKFKFRSGQWTARRGFQFEYPPPHRVEFLARQSVLAGIQMHAHIGNLVGYTRSRSTHKINIGSEYQYRTGRFGKLLGISSNIQFIRPGESSSIFQIERRSPISRL